MDRNPNEETLARGERGFTMVELMMVVLIMGILMGIAVPTFAGARNSADDRAAETVVRHALIAARAAEEDGAGVTLASLEANEPQLDYLVAGAVGDASLSQVSVATGVLGTGPWVILASRSKSTRCFALLDNGLGQVLYQRTNGACTAASFDPTSGWSDSWP